MEKITRLRNEYENMRDIDSRSRFIKILQTDGRNPPEKYEVELICKGIRNIDPRGNPVYADKHVLRIFLPPGFPKQRPLFEMVTPIWHPNIASSGDVCYGDEGDHGWAPDMKISDIVIRIIEMIRYENVCENSAFNGSAAAWSIKHKHLFPLQTDQILSGEVDIVILEDDVDVVILDNDVDGDLLDQIVIT